MDSDDYIAPDMYEKMVDKLLIGNADICACNFYFIDENGREDATAKIIDGVYNRNFALRMSAKKVWNEGIGSIFWNKLFKRNCLNAIRFPQCKLCEDEAIMTSVIDNAEKIVCIETPLYYYTVRHDSLLRTASPEDELSRVNALINKNIPIIKRGLYDAAFITVLKEIKEIHRINKARCGKISFQIKSARKNVQEQIRVIIKTMPLNPAAFIYKPLFLLLKVFVLFY